MVVSCNAGSLYCEGANGNATFSVSSLSRFTIFLKDGLNDIPKTGDNSSPWVWQLVGGIVILGISLLSLRRKKAKMG